MTEEQIEIKSREYAEGRGHEHYNFLFEENAGSPVDFARLCYADGLKDGATEATKELQEELEESERRVVNYRTWVDKIKALKCVKIGKCADELQELQEQIEKMKCCENCAKRGHICVAEEMQGNLCGKNKDKWELRR